MISTTRPPTKPARRIIPLPRTAASHPTPDPRPYAVPLEATDVWDRVNIYLSVQPRSKLAEAVQYLGIPIRGYDHEGWAEILPTLEEFMWCISYARRYSGDKVPPGETAKHSQPETTLKAYSFTAPAPLWDDEIPPLPEME